MNYPTPFKERVKKLWPNWTEIHRRMDNGMPIGEYLRCDTNITISLNTVLNATSLKELQDLAMLMRERNNLYRECRNLEGW